MTYRMLIDDCTDEGNETHDWGEIEHSWMTHNPHRKCLRCRFISLDLYDDDYDDEDGSTE